MYIIICGCGCGCGFVCGHAFSSLVLYFVYWLSEYPVVTWVWSSSVIDCDPIIALIFIEFMHAPEHALLTPTRMCFALNLIHHACGICVSSDHQRVLGIMVFF